MLLHKDPLFSIYFGDEREQLSPALCINYPEQFSTSEQYEKIKKALDIQTIMILRQVHGSDGLLITSYQDIKDILPFCHQGDYLVTNLAGIGIGIATADCLPIILYDKVFNALAIVHAGWRGSIAGVATQAVARMQTVFGSNLEYVRVFFGPSACVCCYVVDDAVTDQLEPFWFKDQVVRNRNGDVFFDLPLFNELRLIDVGIKKKNIMRIYNECTICNESFCSYRRQGEKAGRQITVVALQ
ncbi:MAG: peptidoglycan editing factor PgeF [Candidatus Babeliales bacterium]